MSKRKPEPLDKQPREAIVTRNNKSRKQKSRAVAVEERKGRELEMEEEDLRATQRREWFESEQKKYHAAAASRRTQLVLNQESDMETRGVTYQQYRVARERVDEMHKRMTAGFAASTPCGGALAVEPLDFDIYRRNLEIACSSFSYLRNEFAEVGRENNNKNKNRGDYNNNNNTGNKKKVLQSAIGALLPWSAVGRYELDREGFVRAHFRPWAVARCGPTHGLVMYESHFRVSRVQCEVRPVTVTAPGGQGTTVVVEKEVAVNADIAADDLPVTRKYPVGFERFAYARVAARSRNEIYVLGWVHVAGSGCTYLPGMCALQDRHEGTCMANFRFGVLASASPETDRDMTWTVLHDSQRIVRTADDVAHTDIIVWNRYVWIISAGPDRGTPTQLTAWDIAAKKLVVLPSPNWAKFGEPPNLVWPPSDMRFVGVMGRLLLVALPCWVLMLRDPEQNDDPGQPYIATSLVDPSQVEPEDATEQRHAELRRATWVRAAPAPVADASTSNCYGLVDVLAVGPCLVLVTETWKYRVFAIDMLADGAKWHQLGDVEIAADPRQPENDMTVWREKSPAVRVSTVRVFARNQLVAEAEPAVGAAEVASANVE